MAKTALSELDENKITDFQRDWTAQWHDDAPLAALDAPWSFIQANHKMNYDLWHEEDVARRDDLGAERVRQAKRVIDKCNQARNDAMERIDLWISERLPSDTESSLQHSETPGMIIDRLSIMALKRYHMQEEASRGSATPEHRSRCAAKVVVLDEQLSDLRHCLAWLREQLEAGERRFKLYRQFKMYNDASLNPQLYQSQGKSQA